MLESDAQSKLVDAILMGHPESSGFDLRGLYAYRRSLAANACRALRISFPTIAKLLGQEAFDAAVERYLSYDTPTGGDWGTWGRGFPAWLALQPELAWYPYLSDCARLDWLCHVAERAPDASFEWESLLDLNAADPYSCYLVLTPGTSVQPSSFPMVDIWSAHQDEGGMEPGALQKIGEFISDGTPQTALIWRKHWKANVRAITNTERRWFSLLMSGGSLGQALDQMAGTEFSFTAWLIEAIRERLISHTTHTLLNA